ncbi:hypothetical protein [Halomicronema sp. CCY15110]|uniref:hypothetical protein n=1 Tax=Halomicronema sp. CCY15110 TaxID=2767773 RepID=UPI00194DE4CC|nr:hypothetical protein [Halomicronema sp. CCY15110]
MSIITIALPFALRTLSTLERGAGLSAHMWPKAVGKEWAKSKPLVFYNDSNQALALLPIDFSDRRSAAIAEIAEID